jgi:uncharacterized membrane protein YeaQ/YmgE (transglycosylase-associated protein family)
LIPAARRRRMMRPSQQLHGENRMLGGGQPWYCLHPFSPPFCLAPLEFAMTGYSLLIFLFIGAMAGWLAGLIVRGFGFGLLGNIVVGIIGAFLAGWLLPALGVHFMIIGPIVTSIIHAMIGAIVLLVIIGLFRRV